MKEKKNQPHHLAAGSEKVEKPDDEWKKLLPPELYHVAREKGTERPFTSQYNKHYEIGSYLCAACGNPLFQSDAKFDSSCGWPSFFKPITEEALVYSKDNSFGMQRIEVTCGRCHAHLGHVFEDGPPPSGLRYCINGVVLDFEKAQNTAEE
ncbi:MAG TPA: peptide-methionine (R)-S-oxide reductase MsrB [Arachidicoccus soli]|nr:peptide-methionine (R)-S-oxide reductase MsrB [Arachidicoccus soli]